METIINAQVFRECQKEIAKKYDFDNWDKVVYDYVGGNLKVVSIFDKMTFDCAKLFAEKKLEAFRMSLPESKQQGFDEFIKIVNAGLPTGDAAVYEYGMNIMMAFMAGRCFQEDPEIRKQFAVQ